MTTKTAPEQTGSQERLEQARERRDALHGQIARGAKVSGADLSHAEAEVRLAELAIEGRQRLEAEAVEQERREHVAQLVARLAERGSPAGVAKLATEAQEALERAYVAAERHAAAIRAAVAELSRIGTSADGVQIPAVGLRYGHEITVGGTKHRVPVDLPRRVVAGVAWEVLHGHEPSSSDTQLLRQATGRGVQDRRTVVEVIEGGG